MSSQSPTIIHPSREHVLGGFVMFLMCLMFTGHNPQLLFWVPLIPLLFIIWIYYVRTIITPEGITARYAFRPNKHITWNDLQGIHFSKRGRAYAASTDTQRFWLPGVSFNSLATLSEASNGHIPDPVTPAKASVDSKVQVVHKEGYAVLMDKEEYKAYEAQQRAQFDKQQTSQQQQNNK